MPASGASRPWPAARPAGRSSATCLQLSHVCPLKYDLLFERFLDPNRSEAPDIDIDLCQERRYEVIEYVRKKYGDANVAQIGTFGTMEAKAAIKDVGRALNIPLARVEQVTKLVPTRLNITLDDALKEEPALKRLVRRGPRDRTACSTTPGGWKGRVRNVSTHAAGVVIADRPLEDLVPLQKTPEQGQGQGGRQHPVGDGRRREGRPAEDGLPRPPEPDEPRRRRPAHQRSATPTPPSTSNAFRSTTPTPIELFQQGRGQGRLPARDRRASATCWSR